jgi:hypothetical protein
MISTLSTSARFIFFPYLAGIPSGTRNRASIIPKSPPTRKPQITTRPPEPWSFHLADCFYPIPALHFAENFAALPA